MKVQQIFKHPLDLAHYTATKRVITQWAHKFDLVYFGHMDHQNDEYEMVRGITLSAQHNDDHYTVGSFRNHYITLVERQHTLTFPGKQPKHHRWLLLQFDLEREHVPHIFIDANHHEEVFYANLFMKLAQFDNAGPALSHAHPLFARHFKVFAETQQFDQVAKTLTHDITAMLVHHFRRFDYEIFDDWLIVYASNTVVTLSLLREMMRVGSWLAEQLDALQS